MKKSTKRLLRFLSIVPALLAVMTVLPHGGADSPSILGYKALCPFAPFSTIILMYLALTAHRYLGSANDGTA
ncbi:hypothetical protein JCM14469_29930 [Desulfatiferula olefinivorans]